MTEGFTDSQLAILMQAGTSAFKKTGRSVLIGKSIREIEGLIYTRIRTELTGMEDGLSRKFGGQYKMLSCRMTTKEKEQFKMICDTLTKQHLLDQEDTPGTIDGLKLTLASAKAAVKSAEVAAHAANEVGEKLNKLERELEERR